MCCAAKKLTIVRTIWLYFIVFSLKPVFAQILEPYEETLSEFAQIKLIKIAPSLII